MNPLMAALAAATITTSPIDDGYPPVSYQKDTAAVVVFVDNVDAICGAAPKGYVKLACAFPKDTLTVMPNPCKAEFRGEKYARVLCHEMGHINGWPGDHPRETR